MTEEDKTMIESLINEASEYNLTRLKNIGASYGAPQPSGCFCKEYNRTNYLNQFKEWFNNYINND